MTTRPITTRLSESMDRDIRAFWERLGEKPSPGYRRAIEEWWTMQQLPLVEFRDGVTGRRAGLREGPDVWEICMVARDYGWDIDRLFDDFGGHISRDAFGQARRYEELFPDQIRARLDANDRVARMLQEQL